MQLDFFFLIVSLYDKILNFTQNSCFGQFVFQCTCKHADALHTCTYKFVYEKF